MSIKVLLRLLITLALPPFLPFKSLMAQDCSKVRITQPIENAEASAGFFANLRGSEKSIRVRSDSILENTKRKVNIDIRPGQDCPAGCKISQTPKIIFKAIPNKFLSDYDDSEKCAAKLKATSYRPLNWPNVEFEDYEEFSKGFSDFSRGKGRYGEELYEKCDGSCSPQYTITIDTESNGHYSADVNVICGHERDKDDDIFNLSTEFLWTCELISE